jgi:hypothetical protein
MRAQLIDKGGRGLDPQLTLVVHADGFITAGLPSLPVGGQEHPCRIPAAPPLLFGHLRGVEVVSGAPQAFPTHHHRRTPRRQRRLDCDQPLAQHDQPAGLGEPLRDGVIAPSPPRSAVPSGVVGVHWRQLARAQRAARLQNLHRRAQSATWAASPRIPN